MATPPPAGKPSVTGTSSKGQVVIPEAIRKKLRLAPGAQFVVVADENAIVLTSKAVAVVSGDKQLLDVSGHCGIDMLTPRQPIGRRFLEVS